MKTCFFTCWSSKLGCIIFSRKCYSKFNIYGFIIKTNLLKFHSHYLSSTSFWTLLQKKLWLLKTFSEDLFTKTKGILNPIQDWAGQKKCLLPVGSTVTSSIVGISPQTFLIFCFNHFATLVWNIKFIPGTTLELLNLNQDHTLKKPSFLVKPLQNWSYDNFSHRNVRVGNLWSQIFNSALVTRKILFVTSWKEFIMS